MNLDQLRNRIDEIDDKIVELFVERTKIACGVAEYKKANNMAVLQSGREKAILDKVASKVPPEMKNASRLLFTTLMDISKCRQQQLLTEAKPFPISTEQKDCPKVVTVTKGSYSSDACRRFFGDNCKIEYFTDFYEVFNAVEQGEADYGVIPIENSTAGDVSETYDLMGRHNFYICKSAKIKIEHILAVKKGVKPEDVRTVMSKGIALKQCSGYIKKMGFAAEECSNTAAAAKKVAAGGGDAAAICSRSCAELFGLEAAAENIADIDDNYTRFIMISKKPEVSEKASIVSLSLSLPHTPGSLYSLLTRFAYCGLNLCRIESKPMPSGLAAVKDDAFDFLFYLDFVGSIRNEEVVRLLANLEKEMKYYRFLGNYEEI